MSQVEESKNAKLFVGNLTYKVHKDDLNNVFRPYGEIQDIKIIDKGRHVYGFVEFTNIGDAEEAYRELQGKEVRGTNLKIEYAQGPRNKTRYYQINKQFYFKEDFFFQTYSDNNNSKDKKERQECYQCGSTRHFKRDCPQLKRSRSRSRDRDRTNKSKKKKSHKKRSSSSSRSASSSADKKRSKKTKNTKRSVSVSKSNKSAS